MLKIDYKSRYPVPGSIVIDPRDKLIICFREDGSGEWTTQREEAYMVGSVLRNGKDYVASSFTTDIRVGHHTVAINNKGITVSDLEVMALDENFDLLGKNQMSDVIRYSVS